MSRAAMVAPQTEVVRRAQSGDAEAFGEIVAAHQARVFALALRLTGDRAAAADLAQETFLRAFERLRSFDGRSAISTWLYRITINICLRHVDRQRRLTFGDWPPIPEDADAPDPALGPEALVLRDEVKVGCLTGLVRCLPLEQRAAFVLATLLELPDKDVAAILECSSDAVRARLTRARDALASFLDARCQWIDPDNRCRCHRYIEYSKSRGLVSGNELGSPPAEEQVVPMAQEELGRLREIISLYRRLPPPRHPEGLVERVRRGIASGEWRILT